MILNPHLQVLGRQTSAKRKRGRKGNFLYHIQLQQAQLSWAKGISQQPTPIQATPTREAREEELALIRCSPNDAGLGQRVAGTNNSCNCKVIHWYGASLLHRCLIPRSEMEYKLEVLTKSKQQTRLKMECSPQSMSKILFPKGGL